MKCICDQSQNGAAVRGRKRNGINIAEREPSAMFTSAGRFLPENRQVYAVVGKREYRLVDWLT